MGWGGGAVVLIWRLQAIGRLSKYVYYAKWHAQRKKNADTNTRAGGVMRKYEAGGVMRRKREAYDVPCKATKRGQMTWVLEE